MDNNELLNSENLSENKKKKPQKLLAIYKTILFSFGILLFIGVVITLIMLLAGEQLNSTLCSNQFVKELIDCKKYNLNEVTQNNEDGKKESNNTIDGKNDIIEPNKSTNKFSDLSELYLYASPSVVGIGIINGFSETENVIGTGFVISEDGYIATNQHVVSNINTEYFVKFNDRDEFVPIKEIFRDQVNDIAIVKVEVKNLRPLKLSEEPIIPGQPVVAIGNPLGELHSTITSGIVSGTNRTVEAGSGESFLRSNVNVFEDTIQTDAAINPGNSGGPLLNTKGEVIGINFATTPGYDNLSFALPVSYLKTRIDEITNFGKFKIAYLGIEYRTRTFILENSILTGAQVMGLDPQGTANELLKKGDIIIKYNNTDLSDATLLILIQKSKIGEDVQITYIRDGELINGTIKVGERGS